MKRPFPLLPRSLGPGRDEDVALYVKLTDALNDHSPGIFLCSALCLAIAGFTSAVLASDPVLATLVTLGTACALVRTAMLMRRRRKGPLLSLVRATRLERNWASAAYLYCLLTGLIAFRAFAFVDHATVHLLIGCVAIGTLSAVTVSAVRPRVVLCEQLLIIVPMSLGLAVKGGAFWSLALAGGPFLVLTVLSTRYLHRIMVGSIRAEEALKEESARLEGALDTMAQGLCLFGPDGRLKGFNDNYLSIWGFDPAVVRHGISQAELADHAVDIGFLPAERRDLVMAEWEERARRACDIEVQLNDGRTLAISYRPMADGGHVATTDDITDRVAAEARLDHMARHDALTDLPNRRELHEELARRLHRHTGPVAVHIVDLDGFKAVNDTLGHATGDTLLIAVAAKLTALAQDKHVFLARLGGDEFALIQTNASLDRAADVGRAVCALMAEPFTIEHHQVVVGASVGIALSPVDGQDAGTLLRCADLALYRAKAEGRGQCRLFERAMDAHAQARRTLELDLRRAIAKGEFVLHYQPMHDRLTRSVTAFEALLRWRHPERGLLLPDQFMELAESAGLIVPIGEWVFSQAMHDAVGWPTDVRLAINVSPAQFRHVGVGSVITRALAASGLAPDRLELEITETVMLDGTVGTLDLLHSLRALGVRIALDDFGTGYSSLSYLRAFPFDRLKIDRSFVAEMGTRSDAAAIVRAVTDLASSLGMATTAEGVEDAEQLALLDAHGCTEVQGHLFSRAVPLAEASAILARRRAA